MENPKTASTEHASRVLRGLLDTDEDIAFVDALVLDDLDAMCRTLGIMASAAALGPAMGMTELDQREMLVAMDTIMPLAVSLGTRLTEKEVGA